MPLYFIVELLDYYLWGKRFNEEFKEEKERTRKEARAKLVQDFHDYKEEFKLLRGNVDIIKIRNMQKKYQFELHLKTDDGTFTIDKMYTLLSRYDARNRQLRWDIETHMPDKREVEPYFTVMFKEALEVLREDRRKLEDLKSEIRPFVEVPI